jgi:hypothetical protein
MTVSEAGRHLTVDRREVGRVAPEECKRSVEVDDGALCKKIRNTTEAISAIAAGEAERSFRLQKA